MILFVGIGLGAVSLFISILKWMQSARLRHALEIMMAQIREANLQIVERSYSKHEPNMIVHQIRMLADDQKREINGIFHVLKFRYWNIWTSSKEL